MRDGASTLETKTEWKIYFKSFSSPLSFQSKIKVIIKTDIMRFPLIRLLVVVTFSTMNICFTASFSIQRVPRVSVRSFSETSRFAVRDDQDEVERKHEHQDFATSLFWVIPWFNAVAAMNSYEYIARQFKDYVAAINSLNWDPGETHGSLIISPVLNGPLSTSIAITFGTLVAITVSTHSGGPSNRDSRCLY